MVVAAVAGVTSAITLGWAIGITFFSVAMGMGLCYLSDSQCGAPPPDGR